MSQDRPVRVGIIGAGAFSRFAIAAYRRLLPETQIQAITCRTRYRAEALAADFGIPDVLPDNESLLRHDGLDLVVILTTPDTHFDLAHAALCHGHHVLVDKPIAFTSGQARQLAETARERNLRMATNLVLRVHRFNRQIRALRESGEYGRLVQIVSTAFLARHSKDHWYWDATVSGGVFLNTFVHFIDLFDCIVGSSPERVGALGDTEYGYTLNCVYPGGVRACLNACLQVSNENETVRNTYVFEKGIVETEGWLPDRIHFRPEHGEPEILQANPKRREYQDCLAQILLGLMECIRHPDQDNATGISLDVICNSVILPLRYQQSNCCAGD